MSEAEQSDHLNEAVYAEQVRLLYAVTKYRPVLHLIFAIVVVLIVLDSVPLPYIAAWVIGLFALNIYRIIDIGNIQKIIDKVDDWRPLHIRFVLFSAVLGLTYSLGFSFIFTQLALIHQIYLLCLIATLVPAGLVSFASDRYSFYAYFYSLCVPLLLYILLMAKSPYISIGICAIAFMVISRQLFLWNHEVIKNSIELKLKNEELLKSLQQTNIRLQQQNIIDDLTKIPNRRHFDEILEKEWLRAKRIRTSLALLMIDIDFFKQYNDTFGHLKGDECLKQIATVLSNNLNRPGDFVARYGGEEFCILVPDTDMDGAITFAEVVHSAIIELKIDNPGSEVSKYLTISIGIAAIVPKHDDSYMDLIYTSDKALYKAKNDGRNIIRTKETLERNPKPKLVI
jgi:diguanylate cyclase (GGDEF)-like protein